MDKLASYVTSIFLTIVGSCMAWSAVSIGISGDIPFAILGSTLGLFMAFFGVRLLYELFRGD